MFIEKKSSIVVILKSAVCSAVCQGGLILYYHWESPKLEVLESYTWGLSGSITSLLGVLF